MKLLYFSPFAYVWTHSMQETLLLKGLRKNNDNIIYVTCNGIYKRFCASMACKGLNEFSSDEDKLAACRACIDNKNVIKKQFNFRYYEIDDFIDESLLKNIINIADNIKIDEFYSFKLYNHEIGKYALYDFLIHNKKMDYNFSKKEFEAYKLTLINCLITYYSIIKIIELEKPEILSASNTLYSLNRVVKSIGDDRRIPVYSHHAGDIHYKKYHYLIVYKDNPKEHYKNLRNIQWQNFKNTCLTKSKIKNIRKHFYILFNAGSYMTYSSKLINSNKINIREYFNIKSNQKILVATMSSYDEMFANYAVGVMPDYKNYLFQSLLDWIVELINWIKNKPDLFLLIRVHPREFPNRRESRKSEHVDEIKKVLSNLPQNAKINWPDDNISIYNLMEDVDLFLNAWSNAGNEMSFFGIPVVLYSKDLVTYPYDLNYVGESKEDYFNKIDIALNNGWNFNSIKMSFRWYSLMFNGPVIKIYTSIFYYLFNFIIKNVLNKKIARKLYQKIFKKKYNQNILLQNTELKYRYFKNKDIKLVQQLYINKLNNLLDIKKNFFLSKNNEVKEKKLIIKEFKHIYNKLYQNLKTPSNHHHLHYKLYNFIKDI